MGTSSLMFVVGVLSCVLLGITAQTCKQACTGGKICNFGKCTKLKDCECAANPKALTLCTYTKKTGNDKAACEAADCCWNTKKSKCHTKNPKEPATSCATKLPASQRGEAGWGRITANDCMCVGGCFDDSIKSYWCFVPPVDLNKPCTTIPHDLCKDPNASCQNGFCKCNAGYYERNGVCVEEVPLDKQCDASVDVCADPNASCTGGVCACNAGYKAQNGVCAKEVDLGEDCSGANVVCKDPNASCQNGVCKCNAGFTNSNGVCVPEKDLGEACSGTDVCKDPHASCTGGVCACNAGYIAKNGVCVAEKDLGEACGTAAICKDPNASCVGGICACNAGYHNKNGVCTLPVDVDGPCDAADVCKDPNAVCTNGKCQCTVMFNFRDGLCKEICKKRIMDIVFVIDNSGSIDATEMAGQKLFLEKLTESFTIDDTDTRVGLVRFGTASRVLNPLNSRNTPGDVDSDLRALAIANEYTNTPAGLIEMTNLFNSQGGSHQKLGVLLTDGGSNRGNLPPAITGIPSDVTMFSVGVDGYKMSELLDIAGDADRVYATQEFDALIKLIPLIREDMCPP